MPKELTLVESDSDEGPAIYGYPRETLGWDENCPTWDDGAIIILEETDSNSKQCFARGPCGFKRHRECELNAECDAIIGSLTDEEDQQDILKHTVVILEEI